MDFADLPDLVRSYMSDVASKNKLNMQAKVLEDSDYETAIKNTANEWDTTPPLGIAAVGDIETAGISVELWSMMLKGVACHAIDIMTSRDIQNSLSYQDKGGLSVSEFGKDQSWRMLRDSYWADYQTAKLNYKKALNMKTFWG